MGALSLVVPIGHILATTNRLTERYLYLSSYEAVQSVRTTRES